LYSEKLIRNDKQNRSRDRDDHPVTASATTVAARAFDVSGRRTLVVLLAGQAMASIDGSIVNVAAPSIRRDLHASGAAIQMILVGYLLSYAVLVITGARIGAKIGARTAFLVGLCGFVAASFASGLAPDPWTLVAARVAQGAGGALMVPQVIVLIQRTFEGERRTRAIGYYSLILSLGVLAGQSIGGALVSANLLGLGWRPLFLLNIPLGALVFVVARRDLPRDEPDASAGTDLGGVILLGAAMLALMLPLIFGRDAHWATWTWALLGLGAAGTALFVRYERRRATHGQPQLLDLSVLADRRVCAAGLSITAAMAGYAALIFSLTLHLQGSLGFSALHSGATVACYAAGFGTSSLLSRRITARIGLRYTVWGYVGFGIACIAIALLARHGVAWYAIPVLFSGGWCHAVTFAPLFSHVLGQVDQRHAPEVSGLLSTSTLLGGAASIAGMGTVYFAAPSSSPGLVRVALIVAVAMIPAAAAAAYASRPEPA
jgi:predicted MFS family arabinose efflux permease